MSRRIQLNPGQESIVEEAVQWFRNSPEQVFEFDGGAGTGKSVVLREIVRRLGLGPEKYMPMAYTGQAAIVMRMKGFPHSRSIHSSLFKTLLVEEPYNPFDGGMNTTLNRKKYFYDFRELEVGEISDDVRLFVIDEGYMVPESMRNAILKHGIKVLVAGDAGQLPPIAGRPAFLIGPNVRHLTQNMRQGANNPILYIADRARKGLPIHCGNYGNRVLVIEDYDLTNRMVLEVGNVICGTNKTRDYFNNKTRELLHIDSSYPRYGERVICRENNWSITADNIALANGLTGVIASPYSINAYNNRSFSADFLPDLLNHPFRSIDMDYEYMISPYDVRAQMKNDKFSNGIKFEFAYAITTHLAQGAEYSHGIYYEEFLRSNIQNQLNYTGITRFRDYMIYVKKTPRRYY